MPKKPCIIIAQVEGGVGIKFAVVIPRTVKSRCCDPGAPLSPTMSGVAPDVPCRREDGGVYEGDRYRNGVEIISERRVRAAGIYKINA